MFPEKKTGNSGFPFTYPLPKQLIGAPDENEEQKQQYQPRCNWGNFERRCPHAVHPMQRLVPRNNTRIPGSPGGRRHPNRGWCLVSFSEPGIHCGFNGGGWSLWTYFSLNKGYGCRSTVFWEGCMGMNHGLALSGGKRSRPQLALPRVGLRRTSKANANSLRVHV